MIIKLNGLASSRKCFVVEKNGEWEFHDGTKWRDEIEFTCLFGSFEEAEKISKNLDKAVVVPVCVTIREVDE